MNKIILIGRLVKDPVVRHTQNNIPVASFSLAVDRRKRDETDFFNCIAWDKTAEFVQKYFTKGQSMALVGRLQNRTYDDEQGQKHYVTEVVAEEIHFCGSKRTEEEKTEENTEEDNFELPF